MSDPRPNASGSSAVDRWWPSTQALGLIEGDFDSVVNAVAAQFREVAAYSGGDIIVRRRHAAGLDVAFGWIPFFDNVASQLLLLPTRSRWVVLWSNSFLCDGNDLFCRGLTTGYGLTTIHWSAHDTTTTFQPGAMFHIRRMHGGSLVERRVQAASTDGRWKFYEHGQPLPEEDPAWYRARRVRDRFNEGRAIELLARLGARPWTGSWYALPEHPVCHLERPLPATALRRDPARVITGRMPAIAGDTSV